MSTELVTTKPRTPARPEGASHLTREQVDALGRELDAIRAQVMDSLGANLGLS